jgi:hypothetical protein
VLLIHSVFVENSGLTRLASTSTSPEPEPPRRVADEDQMPDVRVNPQEAVRFLGPDVSCLLIVQSLGLGPASLRRHLTVMQRVCAILTHVFRSYEYS